MGDGGSLASDNGLSWPFLKKKIMGSHWDKSTIIDDISTHIDNPFVSEKEMCDYIDKYSILFAVDVLEIDYKSHIREYYLGNNINLPLKTGNAPRVDFLFESKQGEKIIIECKNPNNNYAELIKSIGQILSYYCIAKDNGIIINRMCLVFSNYTQNIGKIIKEFNLPIEVYVITKNSILKLIN